MRKILYFTHQPSPYRVDFFNEIGKFTDLTVVYERNLAHNRNAQWYSQKAINFKTLTLKMTKFFGCEFALSKKIINEIKADIIIFGGYSSLSAMLAIFYCQFKGIPYSISSDGSFPTSSILKRFLKRMIFRKTEYFFSPSKLTNLALRECGVQEEQIVSYHFTSLRKEDFQKIWGDELLNKFNMNTFLNVRHKERKEMRNRLGIKDNKMILAVGQFIYRKGFDVLIKAAEYLEENVSIYIVGDEPTEEYLSIVENIGLKNIHFVGFKIKQELTQYYLAADVFVLPTREDIWGLVINEALAYGLPVISTKRCMAALELVKNEENGFIVDVDDDISLSEKMNIIVHNDNLADNMSFYSFSKIQEYTIEQMAKDHLFVIDQYKYGNN